MKQIIAFSIIAAAVLFLFSCQENEEERKKRESAINYLSFDARSFMENGNLNDAEEAYLNLLELAPRDAAVYANLALVYLRENKYAEAQPRIRKALKLDPDNPEIRLISARYFEITQQPDKAISELEKILKKNPDYTRALYNLAGMYDQLKEKDAQAEREKYLRMTIDKAPGNIVPRFDLIALLIQKGEYDEVVSHLENLPKIFPEFPKEAEALYDKTMKAFHASDTALAAGTTIQLQNFLKVTSQYQSDLRELKGPDGDDMGFYVISPGDANLIYAKPGESTLHRIRFLDLTVKMNLNGAETDNIGADKNAMSRLALGDFNNDGYTDIYFSSYSAQQASSVNSLLINKSGSIFLEKTKESGLNQSGKETAVLSGDYDNDGYPDLYIVREGQNMLYHNDGSGSFTDVAPAAKVDDPETGSKSIFLDADHDGDLDLLVMRPSSNLLYRNNADGTFSEMATAMGLGLPYADCNDAAFADFDEDGDLDLFMATNGPSNLLLSNERHGKFTNITSGSGLEGSRPAVAVAAADYNNDGFTDLFLLNNAQGTGELYTNLGDGMFRAEPTPWMKSISNLDPKDACFVDFDNDGFLDLIVAGKPASGGARGLFLFHNDSNGSFEDVSNLLPSSVLSGNQVETIDYDKDGDLDILVAGVDGKLHLLHNEGGNLNHYLNVQLVGLRDGNHKNNHFGIGAKVEMRAGDLYQMKVVTEPNIHFGLGSREKADILRIVWTNGAPQNKFFPVNDQDLLELQSLKGSCAFVYTWDGEKYTFFKDIMWRSALGMPLGIMGGNTAYAPSDPSKEYLKIPGELMHLQNGKYILQVTEELWETAYFDKLDLVAVDHPQDEDVFVDERFTMPPYSDGYDLFAVGKKYPPVSATDGSGTNLLQQVLKRDDNYVNNFRLGEYQGITETHDLILDPGNDRPAGDLMLYLNGWIFPSDASINVSLGQSDKLEVIPPQVRVIDKKGNWVTVIPNIGFPMGKDKMMIVDLGGRFLSDDHRVLIRTNMEIYWDEIFFAPRAKPAAVTATRLSPVSADLHYRGFSGLYRKGGRYGPHWFDYAEVSTGQKWRDLIGDYTRFGEVAPLLATVDDKLVIMNSGDEMTVTFDAINLPPLPNGWKRDFLIYSEGWIKDGDLNTAHGKTVAPLPFHDMTRYPYGDDEAFPSDPGHQEYLKTYNTRKVTTHAFSKAVLNYKEADNVGGR